MLTEAIGQLEEIVDTFYVRSLPESYRETFSSGGEWLTSVSKIFFGQRDPISQFELLSGLLGSIGARLVFVVEDLDRNNSRTFDIQEVQAFLQQIKEFPNIAFVLTGGVESAGPIDYPKLCDHIEWVGGLEGADASLVIDQAWECCSDKTLFPCEIIEPPDGRIVATAINNLVMAGHVEMSITEAVARLLNTPRSLRLALARTYNAWGSISGEVNWSHLLLLNVLRVSAPECFSFMVKHWMRLRGGTDGSGVKFKNIVHDDWQKCARDAGWDSRAAALLMHTVLPSSEAWIAGAASERAGSAVQGLHKEKYWRRALNEAVDENDCRDQMVISDWRKWQTDSVPESSLVTHLCSTRSYAAAWEELSAYLLPSEHDRLLLSKYLLASAGRGGGSSDHRDDEVVSLALRIVVRRVSDGAAARKWLEEIIAEASQSRLYLLEDIWHLFVDRDGKEESFIAGEKRAELWCYLVQSLRTSLVDRDAVDRVVDSSHPMALRHLLYESDNCDSDSKVNWIHWHWIVPVFCDSLKGGNADLAVMLAELFTSRDESLEKNIIVVDPDALEGLCGDSAKEVVDLMALLVGNVQKDSERLLIEAIVGSARLRTEK
jgi:hypothetical protein